MFNSAIFVYFSSLRAATRGAICCASVLCAIISSTRADAQNANIETGFRGSNPEISTESATDLSENASMLSRFSLNYTNILFGPSLSNPSRLQPNSNGDGDLNRPVYMRNFLSLSYGATEYIAITGTAYWFLQPLSGEQFQVQDPFMRVSHSSVINTDWGLNLYSDARVHFGVSKVSRSNDRITGFQNFNYLSWQIDRSPATLALRSSAAYFVFASQGAGNDAEFYLAPEFIYQATPKVALTLLYEMGASHQFGKVPSFLTNDGTDLQPGVSWDIMPNLNLNPYLNILTGGKITLASTSVGMFLSWTML